MSHESRVDEQAHAAVDAAFKVGVMNLFSVMNLAERDTNAGTRFGAGLDKLAATWTAAHKIVDEQLNAMRRAQAM